LTFKLNAMPRCVATLRAIPCGWRRWP
jgi:hypothetical protein